MAADFLAAPEQDQRVREMDDRTEDVVEIFDTRDSRIDDEGQATSLSSWF